MRTIESVLRRIDGKRYRAYRELLGAMQRVENVTVRVIRVQPDPYAPPSVVRVETKVEAPHWALQNPIALADWCYRRLFEELRALSKKVGDGNSGYLGVPRPGPIMIRRSGFEIDALGKAVARIWVGLPSRRRCIAADIAESILLKAIPRAIKRVLDSIRIRRDELQRHINAWIEQEYIRRFLRDKGLIAFIGDGSVLPRRAGSSHEPDPEAVPFESPKSLSIEIELPTGRVVRGMALRRGVTLIMGAAFHGKTTLLRAIAAGVYNHVPGDGRELVVTVRNAFYVATEEGRYVHCVDISPFLRAAPRVADPRCFTTSNASGATSVLAALQEAIEVGAELVLIDEDTVATNALYHDDRVSKLIPEESITPLSRVSRALVEHGVSLVIASRGSLDLVAAADTVIVMHRYRPVDATDIAKTLSEGVDTANTYRYTPPGKRFLRHVHPPRRVRARMLRIEIRNPDFVLDLSPDIQLYEETQVNTLREVLRMLRTFEGKSVAEVAREIENTIVSKGFSALLGREPGPDLGEVRALDVAFVLNRLPSALASIVSG